LGEEEAFSEVNAALLEIRIMIRKECACAIMSAVFERPFRERTVCS
jgi:hypothetical protein